MPAAPQGSFMLAPESRIGKHGKSETAFLDIKRLQVHAFAAALVRPQNQTSQIGKKDTEAPRNAVHALFACCGDCSGGA
jgi:hypothetical protein